MTEIIATIDLTSEVVTKYDSLAIERIPDIDEAIRTMTMTASVDDNYGVPDVVVTKTEEDRHVNFDLAFSNMRGNGITGVSLISIVDLVKTYRITTDSGDYYDMVLEDGNGISSTVFNADNTLTLNFTDGTSYTTPRLMPYIAVGTVESLPAGRQASVSITGTPGNPLLNFGIPRGNGVTSIQKTGSQGNVDTYTIYMDDGTSSQLQVTNANIDDSSTSGTGVTWSAAKINQAIANAGNVFYNTVSGWAAEPQLVGQVKSMYVYTDAMQYEGQNIPRIKVGDGQTYLIDLPFLNEREIDHIANTSIHITDAERQFWNNKVTAYENQESLIITKGE